jgi:predicted outer membrane repeat protein
MHISSNVRLLLTGGSTVRGNSADQNGGGIFVARFNFHDLST